VLPHYPKRSPPAGRSSHSTWAEEAVFPATPPAKANAASFASSERSSALAGRLVTDMPVLVASQPGRVEHRGLLGRVDPASAPARRAVARRRAPLRSSDRVTPDGWAATGLPAQPRLTAAASRGRAVRRVIKAPACHHAGAFMRTGRSSALRAGPARSLCRAVGDGSRGRDRGPGSPAAN